MIFPSKTAGESKLQTGAIIVLLNIYKKQLDFENPWSHQKGDI